MKTIEEILKTPQTYLWDDKKTIDCGVSSDSSFIEIMHEFKCLKCDENIMDRNEHLYKSFTETTNAMHITCKSCQQAYFTRKHFKF